MNNASIAERTGGEQSASRRSTLAEILIGTEKVIYIAAPFVFGVFVIALTLWGVEWFMSATAFVNRWTPFTRTIPDDLLPVVVSFRLTTVSLVYFAYRTFKAMAIPPERTWAQTGDMMLALVPIGAAAYMMAKSHFQGFQIGEIEWRFLWFVMFGCVLFDFLGARQVQRLIAAFRRRLDMV